MLKIYLYSRKVLLHAVGAQSRSPNRKLSTTTSDVTKDEPMKTRLKTFATTFALAMAVIASHAVADANGYNYRAYDQATRTSPGGWVTEYSAALSNACVQKRAHPSHIVSIQRVHKSQSWSQAVVITGNVSC